MSTFRMDRWTVLAASIRNAIKAVIGRTAPKPAATACVATPTDAPTAGTGFDPRQLSRARLLGELLAPMPPIGSGELSQACDASLPLASANPLFVVSQKSLTGHAKGGAAAFQMIGLTQVLRTGIIPANRSLDCVDPVLAKHGRLVWSTAPINFGAALPFKAGLVTSLGFGHVSALVAIVHPEAFYASVAAHDGAEAAAAWRQRAHEREAAGLRRIDDAIYGGDVLFERPEGRRLGDGGVYGSTAALEKAIIVNPEARLVDGVLTDTPQG